MRYGLLVVGLGLVLAGFMAGRLSIPAPKPLADEIRVHRQIEKTLVARTSLLASELWHKAAQLATVCPEFFLVPASHAQLNARPLKNESDRLRYNRCAEASNLSRTR